MSVISAVTVMPEAAKKVIDVDRHRQVGSFPQAFGHLTRVFAARAISGVESDGASGS